MNPDLEYELSRCLFQEANDGFFVVHPELLRIVDANPAAQRMTSLRRKQLQELTVANLLTPEGLEGLERLIASCRETTYGVQGDGFFMQRAGHPPLPVHLTVSRLHLKPEPLALLIVRDLSDRVNAEAERRKLETRLLEAQRLESLGLLSGGIAHDFNNLLTAILGFVSAGMRELPEGSAVLANLERAEQAAQRAAELVDQMLVYTGKAKIKRQRVALSDVVRELAQLLSSVVSANAQVELNLQSDLPEVECDVAQIRQVIMNLLTNASDALGGQPGTIRLRTERCEVAGKLELPNQFGGELSEGSYVVISCRDSGCGMCADTLRRIFDPFFTTKFTGRGLGLAAVLGIVKAHRGVLSVETAVGAGSTFRIYLPIGESNVCGTPVVAPVAKTCPSQPQVPTTKTVLVVDDEPAIRDVIDVFFSAAGLAGLPAGSGQEAVDICRQHSSPIDLIVLDMVMPGLSGEATLEQVREIHPDVPVIVMSGYMEEDVASQLAAMKVTRFLQKPFSPSVLVSTIRETLGMSS